MVPICQYETKKRMGESKRNAYAGSQAGSPSKEDHDLPLVGSEGYNVLGDD